RRGADGDARIPAVAALQSHTALPPWRRKESFAAWQSDFSGDLCTHASDLLDFVEAEHSVEHYRFWFKRDSAEIWVAETAVGRSAILYTVALTTPNVGISRQIEIKRLYVLHRFQRKGGWGISCCVRF